MKKEKKKRDCKGSLTVECALVFPLFLYAILAVMYFFQIYHLEDILQQAITKEGLMIAKYGYVYRYIADYESEDKAGDKDKDASKDTSNDTSKDASGNKKNDKYSSEISDSLQSEKEAEDSGSIILDTAKELLITENINAAFFQLKLRDFVDESYINNSIIVGGMEGISTYFSDFMGEDDHIDIVISFYAKTPIKLPGTGKFFMLQRVTLRGWSGYHPNIGEEGDTADTDYVYITENGDVYHLWEDCTYLKLSIKEAILSNIKNLSNISGGKYTPCEICGRKQTTGMVYITDTGDRYHTDLNCSALKRTVIKIPLSEAEGRSLCQRCRKRQRN